MLRSILGLPLSAGGKSNHDRAMSFPKLGSPKSKLMGGFGAATTKQRSKQLKKRKKKVPSECSSSQWRQMLLRDNEMFC